MRRPILALALVAAVALTGCGGAIPPANSLSDAAMTLPPMPDEPSVEAALPAPEPAAAQPDLRQLRQKLNQYLAEQNGTYGVFIIDLKSGRALSINGSQRFPAASTFKLPVTLYVLNQVERGKASLDEVLTYSDEDWEDGTGVLQASSEGDTFTIRQLVELAITHSDNIAHRMLIRRFGLENIMAYMESQLGGRVVNIEDGTVVTTPRDMALYMRQAQSEELLREADLRGLLLDSLENSVFTDRVAAGVPDGVPVAHKIGTLPGVVNDVALVNAPDRPFIIAAFSMDVWEDEAAEVIAGLTRTVYDYLNSDKES